MVNTGSYDTSGFMETKRQINGLFLPFSEVLLLNFEYFHQMKSSMAQNLGSLINFYSLPWDCLKTLSILKTWSRTASNNTNFTSNSSSQKVFNLSSKLSLLIFKICWHVNRNEILKIIWNLANAWFLLKYNSIWRNSIY